VGEVAWALAIVGWNATQEAPPIDCFNAIQQTLDDPKKAAYIPIRCWRFTMVRPVIYTNEGWAVVTPPVPFPERV
jgi:hypothetical protein